MICVCCGATYWRCRSLFLWRWRLEILRRRLYWQIKTWWCRSRRHTVHYYLHKRYADQSAAHSLWCSKCRVWQYVGIEPEASTA